LNWRIEIEANLVKMYKALLIRIDLAASKGYINIKTTFYSVFLGRIT